MTTLRVLVSRFLALFTRPRGEGELRDEVQSHLELIAAHHIQRGLSPHDAELAARREFGGVDQTKEICRDQRGFPFIETLGRDIWYSLRQLRAHPGFSAVAVVTLALGIAATTTVFSVVDATLLRPLPYPDADRLVALRSTNPSLGLPAGEERTAPGNLADWQRQARSFAAVAGYRWSTLDLTGGDRSERLHGLRVTPEFFDVFDARPSVGRVLLRSDRGSAAIVFSHHIWQQRFGADPSLVGKPLSLNVLNLRRVGPTPAVVFGIVAPEVHFPPLTSDFQLGLSSLEETIDFWTPEFVATTDDRDSRVLDVVAKLRSGVTIREAQAEMDTIGRRLAASYPASNRGWGVRVVPLRDQILGGTRRVVVLLFVSAGIVLLVACGNVASLLLVRGMARQREVAIRLALGAGRFRIARQFLIESVLIALAAAVLGVVVTAWALALVRPLLASRVPLLPGIGLNGGVLGFTVASALITACVTGMFPAWRISTSRGLAVTGIEGRGVNADRHRHRALRLLVTSEMALTLLLLIVTGLLVKSAVRLLQVDPGFSPGGVLTMTISLPSNKFEWKHNVVFSRQVIASVTSLAPVRGAAVVQGVPMRAGSFWERYEAEGQPTATLNDLLVARIRVVSPGYFGVMQIPMLSGRDFSERDEVGEMVDGLHVPRLRHVIISHGLASRFWPGQGAVGKRMRWGGGKEWMEVIGVVGDVRYAGVDAAPGFDAYYPEGLFPQAAITLLVRTAGDPLHIVADVRSRIHQIDEEAFVNDVRPMDGLIADSLTPRRLGTILVTAFAGIDLALALVGIYSVIAQSTQQRTHEIGIRMALGAQAVDVMAIVLRQGVLLTAAGVVLGLAGAVFVARDLEGLLFGLTPFDRPTFVVVPMVFAFVAIAASYVPARRATKVNPMVALRCE